MLVPWRVSLHFDFWLGKWFHLSFRAIFWAKERESWWFVVSWYGLPYHPCMVYLRAHMYIYIYSYYQHSPQRSIMHVGKYTMTMDPTGFIGLWFSNCWTIHKEVSAGKLSAKRCTKRQHFQSLWHLISVRVQLNLCNHCVVRDLPLVDHWQSVWPIQTVSKVLFCTRMSNHSACAPQNYCKFV